jgi:hypothetical protein
MAVDLEEMSSVSKDQQQLTAATNNLLKLQPVALEK